MTVVLLVSISLFALVVTSHPVPSDSDLGDLASTSSTLRTASQAAFQIDPGQDVLKLDAGHFQVQEPKQQIEYPSGFDAENIGYKAPTDRQDAFDTNNELDNSRADHVANEPVAPESVADDYQEATADDTPSTPFVMLMFSCISAFLVLACIASALYIVKFLRSQMLASKRAFELLSRLWGCLRSPVPQKNTSATAKGHLLGGGCHQTEVVKQDSLHTKEGPAEMHDLRTKDESLCFDTISDMESEWDDADGKYQDPLDMTPLPLVHDLPLDEHVSCRSHFSNSLLSSAVSSLDQPRGDCSAPIMHELRSSGPDWSARAIDSPALGLSSRESSDINTTPRSLIHPRHRAYRSVVPEFDIALAMQLRPGLGIGADSAWMVRFLMAMFGWFAVALTGNTL